MAKDTASKKESGTKKAKELKFECRFCEEEKPLNDMVVLNRFFPPMVACRDCEKQIQ